MGEQRERRLIAEWRYARYPKEHHQFNAPLGAPEEELVIRYGMPKAVSMSRPWRCEVDCIVFLDHRLLLVEAKVWRPRDALGDLMLYRNLVPDTPELEKYRGFDIELVMVIPWATRRIEAMARAAGVTIDVFAPPWVADFMEQHTRYWTAEYKSAREEKKALRRSLGVE